MLDPVRVEAAAGRFRAFFAELEEVFLERQDVLHQVALALLCKEHALITGPPGTAKSALATAVFGRIVCEQTGAPSVYQRQITESTVQTDLIGPIDFKNLMETGRTTHFTDEGMLGAAHAFLDEVFDGRDMLLRSALNVLQERELKQGTTVTRGQIEVALMTSNRYIADVIEHARETLLAFVDRIAFVSFVPRAFADDANLALVLDRHVARESRGKLDALLTIQDLDVLQELVDSVVVSQPICQGLSNLLGRLHVELNAAVRADPSFIPTRYLSTRTAIRSGDVLRAICVYDRIFGNPERELQALPDDLSWLRLHLLLAGPRPAEVETLLKREADPLERRQLEIIRTEREIFDRCLARLPKIKVKRLPKPSPTKSHDAAEAKKSKKGNKGKQGKQTKPVKETAAWVSATSKDIDSNDLSRVMTAVRSLTKLASAGGADAGEARAMLERAVAQLHDRASQAALDASMTEAPLLETVAHLADLASGVEDDSVSQHAVAGWLRERAAALITVAAHFGAGASSADLAPTGGREAPVARVDRRLQVLEDLSALRGRVAGAATPAVATDAAWDSALDAAEDDIAALWDAAFCAAAEQLLGEDPNAPLPDVLRAIEMELSWLDDIDERMRALRSDTRIKQKAIGARLTDLVASIMRRFERVDRNTLHEEIDAVMAMLANAKLADTIAARDWMLWAAEALVRSTAYDRAEIAASDCSYDGYRQLRGDADRTPLAYTLGEVALRVGPAASPDVPPGLHAVAALLAELPDELQATAATIDLTRIEHATGYLESWWGELCAGEMAASARLDHVVRSRLFDILWDESALARFALEARLIGEVIPAHAERANAVRQRLEALEQATRRGAHALLRQRTDEAWRQAMGGSASEG